MEEIWKDIEGYEFKYQISNFGRIKSLINNIILKQTMSATYLKVCLKRKSIKIHRLVAKAFIPNKDNKTQVNHKDGNKLNNHVDNLEWVSPLDNMRHAISNGLIKNRHYIKDDVIKMRKLRELGYTIKYIALMFSCDESGMAKILNKKHYAFF